MIARGRRRGRYCEPMPTAIAASTPHVTSGDGSPQAVNRRTMRSQASANESERKKIHAKQTTWNVTKRCHARRPRVHGRSTKPGRSRHQRSTTSARPVDPAPDDERPAGAVPEAADEHRQHQVPVREERPAAVPAERDVEVVAQPARERHVPAPPEVRDRGRRVRRVEVLREREAEQERDPDRDVRVAEEVGVDLHRVRVDPDEHLERRVLVRRAEDLVHDVRGEVVRDHDLHEEPGPDEEERPRRVDVARVARRLELRDELARPHDRAGDEVREEREVRGERARGRPARSRRGRRRRRS